MDKVVRIFLLKLGKNSRYEKYILHTFLLRPFVFYTTETRSVYYTKLDLQHRNIKCYCESALIFCTL